MNKYDLEKEINYIAGEIARKYKPQKIILFGSAAKNNFSADSDLDFFIIKEDNRPVQDRMFEVSGMYEHNVATDVLIYTPAEIKQCLKWGDPFVSQIIEQGKVIYG